ncbi:AMP-binding protein [Azonexus hydrophilus]|uniref:AMP-binding protein n=1 Tax=Azonexus hydrophilus TaxID=418702 RepID=UPI0004283250|nr:AMP-binding protein [Azonexus hydrophilus]
MDFIARLTEFADRPLIQADDASVHRYASVLELATAFERAGCARQLVFCLAGNTPGALVGYLALLRCGAVPLMLNSSLPAPQLSALIAAYRPAFHWLERQRAAELAGTREAAAYADHVLLGSATPADYAIQPDLALLVATSGSTGSPMFVRQSRRNLAANAAAIAEYLAIGPDERPITTLPLSYTYGLSIIHSHVLHGCPIALTGKSFFDRGFWDFFREVAPTSFGGVPYHYEMLRKLRFWRMSLPGLRTLTQAGGRMAPEIALEMAVEARQRGLRYYTMYGQAEATARMSYLEPEMSVEKAGSIGRAIPGGSFSLEDEAGSALGDASASGQLVYRGDNVSLGYATGYADLARGDDNQGCLRTGDLARRDSDGYYYITGRLKRFLKLFGHRINLQDVEDMLRTLGHDAACGGEDDHLVIYLNEADGADAGNLKRQLAETLRAPPSAIAVVGVAALPRNDAGKLRYAELAGLAGKTLA